MSFILFLLKFTRINPFLFKQTILMFPFFVTYNYCSPLPSVHLTTTHIFEDVGENSHYSAIS